MYVFQIGFKSRGVYIGTINVDETLKKEKNVTTIVKYEKFIYMYTESTIFSGTHFLV